MVPYERGQLLTLVRELLDLGRQCCLFGLAAMRMCRSRLFTVPKNLLRCHVTGHCNAVGLDWGETVWRHFSAQPYLFSLFDKDFAPQQSVRLVLLLLLHSSQRRL